MGIFSKIKKGLLKTKQQMVSKIELLLHSFTKIDEDLFEQLEETLIMSDVGVDTSLEICDQLRKKIKEQGIKDPKEIMHLIHEIVSDMMGEDQQLDLSTTPSVVMVIGVNGAGKTTTIGKLCYKLKGEGKKVLVAAADTFRAAAIEQLEVWTQRAGVDIVKHTEGSDAAAVVFDAVTAAKARKCDVLVVDTAGRLHNKKNLMDELAKINRIISQQAEGCSIEVLLVLDATTGQNAVNQAKLFKEVADITGIVLTKLDGTAKGGIVISIKNELDIPVKLIGLGEKIDDLQDFNSSEFVDALFGDEVLTGEIHDLDQTETEDKPEDDTIRHDENDDIIAEETESEPVQETVSEETETEPVEETVPEETETEPVEETVPEKTETEPVEEIVPEETETEPVEETVSEKTESEPVEETVPEETESEPIEETVPEEMESEPVEETVSEETESDSAEETVPEKTESEPIEETIPEGSQTGSVDQTAAENTVLSEEETQTDNEQDADSSEETQENEGKKSFFGWFRKKKKKDKK